MARDSVVDGLFDFDFMILFQLFFLSKAFDFKFSLLYDVYLILLVIAFFI